MKKLVVLSAVAMLAVGATGCHRGCSWHRRPRATVACPPAPMVAPASPCCNPVAPVYGAPVPAPVGQTFIAPAPIVTPGPVTTPTQ